MLSLSLRLPRQTHASYRSLLSLARAVRVILLYGRCLKQEEAEGRPVWSMGEEISNGWPGGNALATKVSLARFLFVYLIAIALASQCYYTYRCFPLVNNCVHASPCFFPASLLPIQPSQRYSVSTQCIISTLVSDPASTCSRPNKSASVTLLSPDAVLLMLATAWRGKGKGEREKRGERPGRREKAWESAVCPPCYHATTACWPACPYQQLYIPIGGKHDC